MTHTETTIYVELLDEGTPTWRPVRAERTADGTYRIVSWSPDPEDETWQFPSGSVVRCEWKQFSDGCKHLVAVSLAKHVV